MSTSSKRRGPAKARRQFLRRKFRAAIEQLESRSLLAAFTPGNLVIYRIGATGTDLANAGAPVFLDEYTSTRSHVQSVAMPTTVSGAQRQLVASGLDVSEGFLTRSVDARYLTLTGFGGNVGTANLSSTTSAAVPRVIGRVDATGNVDTSTALTDFVNTGTPRTAVTTNGTDFWAGGGASGGNGGMFYTTFGSTTSTNIGTMPMQRRSTAIVDGQLYASSQGGMGGFSVHTIGTGLPTTSGQTSTLLPGLTTTTGLPTTTSDGTAADTDNFNINLNELNDAPVVAADSLGELGSEGVATINIPIATLLSNDSKGAPNESTQTLTLTGVNNLGGGTVAIVGTNVVFTPDAHFSGNASFNYTIQDDGTNAGMPASLSGSGSATFIIGAINDPPSFVKGADQTVSQDAPAYVHCNEPCCHQ